MSTRTISAAALSIRAWLREHQHTQLYLAAQAGMPHDYLNAILCGRRTLGFRSARRLERAMGVSDLHLVRLL